ncbi:MAG: efflux RND transporter permease subunit [Vampirovibrio sp.]
MLERFLVKLIRQRFMICLFFALCLIGGLIAFKTLAIDAFPDLSNNQVQILTDTQGANPLESEQLVTIPIESMMNGLPKVQEVRSLSKLGVSVVTVVFKEGVNIYFARQLVNEKLQSAKARLPMGFNPELGPITTGMGEIYQYVLTGHGYSPADLKTLHEWDIKYLLRSVPGVNEINTWGGETREYQVTVYPQKLSEYQITLKDVFGALQQNNTNFSGGIIEHGAEQITLRGLGLLQKLDDLGNVIVKYQNDRPIYIKNIATVEYGTLLRQGAVTKDGQGEVVSGIVMMLKGENTRNVITRVKAKINEIQKSLPESVKIKAFYDQTHLVEETLKTVESNLLEGAFLVIGILLLMLGNLRAALIVAVTIPIALMFSFMGMKALGLTANIMSLGAIDFGMIVDGSIVMVEYTLRQLSHHPDATPESQMTLIQNSLQEMARPIFFGVLIITVVYMPILALEGMEYKLFSPMVFTVCFALLGSLLVALLLVPVLCGFFLKGNVTEKESPLIRVIQPLYTRLLNLVLRHKVPTLIMAGLSCVVAIGSLPFLGTEFVPKLDEGSFTIENINLPSISLSEATKVTTRIEQTVLQFPEVKTVVSKIGRPDLATDPMSVYQSDTFVDLYPKSQWRQGLSKDALAVALNRRLEADVPGVRFNFTQPIEMRVNELVSGVKADVAVKLFGENLTVLSEKSIAIESVLSQLQGVTGLRREIWSGSPQITITPDRLKMARYGVNIADLRTLMNTAIMGQAVSEILDGKKRFTLRVKFPQNQTLTPQNMEALLIETADGRRIPLGQVAALSLNEGVEMINREAGQRRIVIQCNVRNRDVGSFVKEAQIRLKEQVKLPVGYSLKWGGQFENQERALKKLAIVVPVSILIIFGLLVATFSAVTPALLVMTNIPFAMVGGICALWIRGFYLSTPTIIGFIALFGVAILNGLVLISTFNKLKEDGYSREARIHKGCQSRLRPVLMTAFVATLGFLPMAASMSSGAEVQKPLATVVIGGLVTSTLLTLLVLPVLYRIFTPPDDTRTETYAVKGD